MFSKMRTLNNKKLNQTADYIVIHIRKCFLNKFTLKHAVRIKCCMYRGEKITILKPCRESCLELCN